MHIELAPRNSTNARQERRESCADRIAWRAAASEGELHPGEVLDRSGHGARILVRTRDTPPTGAVIKALVRGERYPIHYRIVRVGRGASGCAEVACARISGCEYRSERSRAQQRVRAARARRERQSA